MDRKKSLLNVGVSIGFKVILLIGNIIVRRFLIQCIGNEVNGLNSLYLSIIGFLSVAELGVGTAITFSMYKPIVEGDVNKVSALYGVFTRLYTVIGFVILIAGCFTMPFLRFLAKDYADLQVNIYITFFLMLISVVLTYFYNSKLSLINAYKNNYISTTITSCGQILQYVLQVIVLVVTESYVWYLVCRIVAVVVQWGITEIVSNRKYKMIICNKQVIDKATKNEIVKNIKAMFMHKIGDVLVNTVDSIVISAFLGVVILGKYSNYTTIVMAMAGVITLFFKPLTSIIGHLYVEKDKATVNRYFNFFYSFNFIIGCIFFLGYFAIIDELVVICFGKGLEIARSISFIITLNYFIQFMRQATLLFRDATGTFYNDRWKPFFEGVLNIILSIVLVNVFKIHWGDDFAVVGVIVATIITNITICHIVEPYVLFRYALKKKMRWFILKNYTCFLVFGVALLIMNYIKASMNNIFLSLLVNGAISICISLAVFVLVLIIDKDFRYCTRDIFKRA